MQLILTLFRHWLQFSYSCFDRVVLKGYISLLSRPANIVILKSMERGPAFTCQDPEYPTKDPNYVIVRKCKRLYTFYYFYIYDEELGPIYLRVGSYVPFEATGYFNGHNFLARWLQKAKIAFKLRDNSFTYVDDPQSLQKAADSLDCKLIEQRFNYWAFKLGPKFSRRERQALGGLRRYWCFAQVEYCMNFIFKRNRFIRDLYVRSCDLGLMTLTMDRIANIFGRRVTRRIQVKLETVLERMDEGHHVLRGYFKRSFVKQYEKWRTFLRLEVVSNDVKDLGLKRKGLHGLSELQTKMKGVRLYFDVL